MLADIIAADILAHGEGGEEKEGEDEEREGGGEEVGVVGAASRGDVARPSGAGDDGGDRGDSGRPSKKSGDVFNDANDGENGGGEGNSSSSSSSLLLQTQRESELKVRKSDTFFKLAGRLKNGEIYYYQRLLTRQLEKEEK